VASGLQENNEYVCETTMKVLKKETVRINTSFYNMFYTFQFL